jgi:hypothetical protein
MNGELWNRMIPPAREGGVSDALERVRERSVVRRARAARRRRLLAIAAGFVLTFAAGWMAGQATPGASARWMWALRGPSIEESRATFVAVPASDQ